MCIYLADIQALTRANSVAIAPVEMIPHLNTKGLSEAMRGRKSSSGGEADEEFPTLYIELNLVALTGDSFLGGSEGPGDLIRKSAKAPLVVFHYR